MKRSIVHNIRYLLKQLWQFDRRQFARLWFHILTGALTPFVTVIIPSVIIYQLMHQVTMQTFMVNTGLICLGYGVLSGSYQYINEYNKLGFVAMRGAVYMRNAYVARMKLDYAFLHDESKRRLLEEAVQATDRNSDGVEGMYHEMIEFFMALLGLLLYACSSSGLNIWLTVGLLLLVILQYGCFSFAKRYEFSHRNEVDGYMIRSKYLNQIAYDDASAKDIRLYQLQHWIDHKFAQVNQLIKMIRRKDEGAYFIVDAITIVLDFLRDVACYGYLIYQLIQGLPIDQFVFYLGIISGFSIWFKKVGEAFAKMSSYHLMVNRMLDALEIKNITKHHEGVKLDSKKITIEFSHVTFHYPHQDRMILQDVSFTMHAGEKIALVGGNGAGKSTIVNLMLGFYLPVEGSVLINGIDTRKLDLDDLYTHMCGIFQDSVILSYTLAENVSMASLEDTDVPRVIDCIRQAGLWDIVAHLPHQELTYLHKDIQSDGVQLSGGQLQKLFMARALYHQGDCLLLDEPTAALDALAEKAMYESYAAFCQGKSSLFISHRLSSTRFCDKILVLDQESIVEEGTHETLLSVNGIYAKMFDAQSKYYQEDASYENME